MGRILCIGDVHFPWANRSAILRALQIARHLKPTIVLQLGDLYDLYSYSRFARSPNILTPAEEVRRGRRQAEEFWQRLRDAAGRRAQRFQLRGNHDERIAKRVLETMPELERFLDHLSALWEFDGVKTQAAERDELIIDGVCYMHGYRKHGDHVRYNLMSTVCAHSHLGGVVYLRHRTKTLFELNAGYIALASAVPMSYGKQKQITRSTPGVGVIDEYGPRFIPFKP